MLDQMMATRPAGDARRSGVRAKPNTGKQHKLTDGQLGGEQLKWARCALLSSNPSLNSTRKLN